MIYSMTGYANLLISLIPININLELKSVNHRFLDLTIKSPEDFRYFEYEIRETILNKLIRGKIELRISLKDSQKLLPELSLNQLVLNQYINLGQKIQSLYSDIKPLTLGEIFNLNGILNQTNLDLIEIKPIILEALPKLITNFLLSQTTEGEKLADIILSKIKNIEEILDNAKILIPNLLDNYKAKLKQKLLDSLDSSALNEQRLAQEFAYYCQKIDVDEELTRLTTHIKQFKSIINTGGIVGKRLDFITQEMQREANTFGAKSASLETTQYSIELKVLIEQIREQIQNIA